MNNLPMDGNAALHVEIFDLTAKNAALRESRTVLAGALAALIDACDGNYRELTDECRAILREYGTPE